MVADTKQPGRHRRPPERQATYREVIVLSEFRALWLGQALSLLGDQLAQVALAILVYHTTRSPLLTAVTYALTYLPPILGGPLLSGLADHFARRSVMISCDLIRACLVAAMAVPGMPLVVLCVLIFFVVLISAPFSAARAALLPEVLPGDKYVVGSALQNMTHQASQMLGFVAGAALVATLGPYRALALDASTFLASALFIYGGVRRRAAPADADRNRPSLWRMTRAGADLVFGDSRLRTIVMFAWLSGFYILPEGLAPPYAAKLGGGAITVGLLMAAMPTGTVIGAFLFSRLVRPTGRIRAMGWMAMLASAPLIFTAMHPPLWAVLLLWLLSGIGGAYQLAANAAFVQCVPAEGRAQAFGLAQSGLLAAQGLGILAGGAVAQHFGPELVISFTGAAGLCAAAILAMIWTEERRDVIAQLREAS